MKCLDFSYRFVCFNFARLLLLLELYKDWHDCHVEKVFNVNEMNILFGKENKGFGISRVSSTIFLSVDSVDVDVEELSLSC